MATINVQFSDSSETTIISYFGGPQNPSVWSNCGTVQSSDARWATYYNAQSLTAQEFLPSPTAS